MPAHARPHPYASIVRRRGCRAVRHGHFGPVADGLRAGLRRFGPCARSNPWPRGIERPLPIRQGSCSTIELGGASAPDLEDLAAALRAGALDCRLAVLHRDPLRVHDFDFHLVLDAIGFGHGAGSSSVQRGVTGTLVPRPHLTFGSRATVASDPSLLIASGDPSRPGSGALRAPSPRTPPLPRPACPLRRTPRSFAVRRPHRPRRIDIERGSPGPEAPT